LPCIPRCSIESKLLLFSSIFATLITPCIRLPR
jgi:hypothetical protein